MRKIIIKMLTTVKYKNIIYTYPPWVYKLKYIIF